MLVRRIAILFVAGILITSCALLASSLSDSKAAEFEMINVQELQILMESEDITPINVHIPLEGNIPETDLKIPFDNVENYTNILPGNQAEKIIVYCRSGSMGDTASQTLVEMGYSDVSNLEGGYVAWKAYGFPFEE